MKSKRIKVDRHAALLKEAPKLLAWIWEGGSVPDNLTYKKLINLNQKLWAKDAEIYIDDYIMPLYEQYLKNMSADERAQYDALHFIIRDFEELRFRRRVKKAAEWKISKMSLEELNKSESEY